MKTNLSKQTVKLLSKIFNMPTTGILLMVFAVVIGRATFIENDFGTPSAKAVIYNAWWFELLMGLLMVNMIVVVFTHRLYRKEKLVAFIFHIAFITIILGAAVTRYVGYEGSIHIREGEASNVFVSTDVYVTVRIEDGQEQIEDDERVMFSPLSGGKYQKTFEVKGQTVDVSLKSYIPHARYELVTDPAGSPTLTIVTTGQGGRTDKHIRQGHAELINNMTFSLNDTTLQGSVMIVTTDTGMVVKSPVEMRYMRMADQNLGTLGPGLWHPFVERQLYIAGSASFVYKDYNPHATLKLISSDDKSSPLPDAVTFTISKGGESREVTVVGGMGISQTESAVEVGGSTVTLGYGAILLQLPFYLELVDFQLERYPGSASPSSYASEVILKDESQGVHKPFRIYMNNILEHRGFRFYQSSYDQDELGTILSVNHDYWGTFITYWGYFFLFAGLIAIFFSKNTRFSKLSKMIDQVHKKRAKLTAIALLAFLAFPAVAHEGDGLPAPSKEHAGAFGSVLAQSNDGRIMPLNTIAGNILRKVVKKNAYEGLNGDQVFLGMLSHPGVWREEKMIRINHQALANELGAEGKYASYLDFFDEQGLYKMKEKVDAAFAKSPGDRNEFDNELLKVDERINICYMTYSGSFLKIFPIPGHPEDKWTSPVSELPHMSREDSLVIRGLIPEYLGALEDGMTNGDYGFALELVNGIKAYQKKYGHAIVPSETRTNLEIFYNKADIFKRLFPYYTLVGLVFLIVLYIRILTPKREMKLMVKIMLGLVIIGFAIHTFSLGLRWYISGHEPWSDGYESLLYIAWAGLLAGIIFMKKSPITLAVTAILSGVILWVAHLSWMDPEITNLVPVLKSYWLTIHVATIVASYGFLALGALLAFLNLISMIMRNKNNFLRLDLTIKELTFVIEMTLIVGIVLLTVGNFLGGIWANESWGRYWGWDPKETWAMASIIFYAFILHMRFIPGLRGIYAFNLAAVLGLASILMTYFGVNYYLSGLHSYAAGDPVPVPNFVYYTIAIVLITATLAFINELKFRKQNRGDDGLEEGNEGVLEAGPA